MKATFLNRIVEKALGVASPIEPRLPSLFESLPGMDAMPGLGTDRQVTPATAGQPYAAEHEPAPTLENAPHTHKARARSGDDPKIAPRAHAQPGDEPQKTPVAQEAHVAAATLVPANTVLQQIDRARLDTAAHANLNKADPQEDSVVRKLDSVSPMSPALLPTKTPTILRIDDDPHPTRGIAPDEPGQAVHRTQKEVEKGALVPDQVSSLLPPRAAMVAPNMPARTYQDAVHGELTQEQQTPVINVTIGRVEVRAIQGSPSRPRAEPSKPKPLSLDDYLKQQGGRR